MANGPHKGLAFRRDWSGTVVRLKRPRVQIFALDLGGQCRFSFGYLYLLRVCRIDAVGGY